MQSERIISVGAADSEQLLDGGEEGLIRDRDAIRILIIIVLFQHLFSNLQFYYLILMKIRSDRFCFTALSLMICTPLVILLGQGQSIQHDDGEFDQNTSAFRPAEKLSPLHKSMTFLQIYGKL